MLQVREQVAPYLDLQLVAFPQDGLYRAANAETNLIRALDMGGTCTGEHGVGQGKQKYMRREHGDALELMQAIKQALDPQNLMNPGKILPQS